jgi:hypothetical protein
VSGMMWLLLSAFDLRTKLMPKIVLKNVEFDHVSRIGFIVLDSVKKKLHFGYVLIFFFLSSAHPHPSRSALSSTRLFPHDFRVPVSRSASVAHRA